jgi:hypothetical protein
MAQNNPGSPDSTPAPAGDVVKNISWDGSQWVCESFNLRVKRYLEGSLQPVEIDAKMITVKAEPDWLEKGEVQKQEDSWLINLNVKHGANIRPPGPPTPAAADGGPPPVDYKVGEEVKPQPPRDQEKLQVQLTVTVQLQVEATQAAVTAMLGMVPGGAATVSAGLGLSKLLTYVVQPPKVTWTVSQREPFRLSGPGRAPGQEEEEIKDLEDDPQAIVVRSNPLPPGWLSQVTVEAALAKISQKLEVAIKKIEPLADPGDGLGARLKLKSNKLVLHPVAEVDPVKIYVRNAQLELVMVTRSPSLGVQVQKGLLTPAQALDVAIYFRNMPGKAHDWRAAQYFFQHDMSKVAVIPKEKSGAPPDPCLLGLSLVHLKDWPEPLVRWFKAEEFQAVETGEAQAPDTSPAAALNDTFQQATDREATYQAPTEDSWEAAGKPALRRIVCLVSSGAVGPGAPVPEHPDLYFVAPVETEIDLVKRSRKVRLKIRIGPKDFLAQGSVQQLNLKEPAQVEKALVREFTLDLDFF